MSRIHAKPTILAVICILNCGTTVSQEYTPRVFTMREASEARAEYDLAIRQAAIEFASKLNEARKLYMSKLSSAQATLAAEENANPDEVLRIAAEQQRIAALLAEDDHRPEQDNLTPAAAVKITGRMYELGTLRDGELTYQHDNHKNRVLWDDIPRAIDGWHVTRFAFGQPPKIYVTAATAGRVFVIAPAGANYPDHPLIRAGWKATKFYNLQSTQLGDYYVKFDDTAGTPMSWMLYHRVFYQGEEMQVPQDGVHGAPIVVPVPQLILD